MSLTNPRAAALGQRERNKLDKLRRIKDAARELFVAKGFDDTTTREIAIRASVGIGTIFVYAANKRDLLFLIVNDELDKIEQMAEAAVEETASLLDNLLRVARIHYEFFAQQPALSRLVLMDTGLFTGRQRMPDAWHQFRDFVERTEDLPVSMLVRRACQNDPGDAVAAAYDAPFPEPRAKAGARAFPLMLPLSPEDPGAEAGQRVLEALGEDRRPTLMLWADNDPVIPLATGERLASRIGREPPQVIEGASHFLQEDAGPEIGRRIADWLASA